MRQELDLFDDPGVTWDDVRAWVKTYAPHMYTPRSYRRYVRWWNITDKIRRAKAAGEWPPQKKAAPEGP